MSTYNQTIVSFNCSNNEAVAVLAREHMRILDSSSEYSECLLFLRDLAQRSGENPGLKGGISLWGTVGRLHDTINFINGLKGFWYHLLASELDGGPTFSDKVIVFYEREGSHQAHCFEIGFAENDQFSLSDFVAENGRPPDASILGEIAPALVIKHHDLPFAWML